MRLILVGFGTVGQGLAELLVEKKQQLARDHAFDPVVVGITDFQKGSVHDPEGVDLVQALELVRSGRSLTELAKETVDGDAVAFLQRVDADVMLEATYTNIETAEPATSHIRAALGRGMHVATTNKGPIALFYPELRRLAAERNVQLLFEGTVMSGTPVINLIRGCLAGAEIREIRGILNGTTNYILTRMEEGLGYEEALQKAQELGYAEAVPDADVLGLDALAKVTILANVFFGGTRKPQDYPCRGITEITPSEIAKARQAGQRHKLIGRVWREEGVVRAEVSPQRIDLSHPLAGVSGATNALTFTTDALGDVTIVGPGAGRVETGFSLLIDLIHLGVRP
jgi:homoserine dehydrogenase